MGAVGLALAGLVTSCGGEREGRTAASSAGSDELRGSVFTIELAKPNFTFADTQGEPYDFTTETRGTLTFLFFGFTNCPDVCPVHMSALASALTGLPLDDQARVAVVFVTVDPGRDTPDRTRAWLDGFDERFVGLVPTLDEANAVLGELLMAPASHVPRDDGTYDVVHPAAVVAFTPDGRAIARYGFGTRRADWAHDLPLLLGDR